MIKKKFGLFGFICILAVITALLISSLPNNVSAAGPWSVSSPDGSIILTVTQAGDGSLIYSVTKAGTTVIESSTLGINTGLADFRTGLAFSSGSSRLINESYNMVSGKKSPYVNYCNELTLNFTKNSRQMNLIARAYNDGIAYRYNLPTRTTVAAEYSQFNLPNGTIWIEDRHGADEGDYISRVISSASATTTNYATGAAVRLDSGYYLWLGEAAVYADYCTSNLRGSGSSNGIFNIVNISGSPCSTGTNNSPWRVAVIGGLNNLIETTLVESLNPPSEIGDTSWIKTGGCAWEWMNGDPTNSLAVAKQYIDFAASMGWKYYIADEGWSDSWAPEMCAYGNSKGVGVILWSHHANLDTQAEVDTLLPKWAGWGAKGIKVDFFDGERQLENEERDRVAVKAAQLKLVVDYHGILKPSGQTRRWPHILTWEGIKGAENYPNSTQVCTQPFTRCVAGPSDYTPVNTWNGGTPGYETAVTITHFSGLICYCSKPSQYNSYLTKEFIKLVPGSYDETRFIEGNIGSYVTIARRKDNNWFVGGITVNARTATVPLSFLGSGTYVASIYCDNTYTTQNVTNATVLSLPCVAKGGFVIYISAAALPTPTPIPIGSNYEAENGALSGGATTISGTNYSGGYKVGYIGGTSGNGICTLTVNVAMAGTYRMTVYYTSAETRAFYVTVNNGGFVGLSCPGSGSWSTVSTTTMDINLNAGINTIKFDNGSGSWAPDLDRIMLAFLSGPTPTPATGVIFYQDINYGGTASPSFGKGDYSSLPGGVPNDWMSSLKVPSGWTVEVYQHSGFGETIWIFTADTPWVGSACNDQMSSFKIY